MRILIVDGTNNFLRNYVVVPALDSHGNPVGGIVGFMFSLKNFISFIKPNKVIVVWDGPGGSQKRRSILKSYKQNRRPASLNRNYDFETENPEENKLFQQKQLIKYLTYLPVHQVMIDNIEADDVIAYLCRIYADDQKVIASGDNDFCQLLDNKTLIYKPIQKTLFSTNDCLDKFGIHPNNFGLAKAIVGDKSDNVAGVKGVGFKSLLKMCPQFGEKEKIKPEQLLTELREKGGKYSRITNSESIVMTNLRVVRLDETLISFYSITKIDKALQKQTGYNKTFLRRDLFKDGIAAFKDDNFYSHFNYLK